MVKEGVTSAAVVVKRWTELTTAEVYAMAQLRTEVFVRAQGCDDIELDGRDMQPQAYHLFLPADFSVAQTPATVAKDAPLRPVDMQNPPQAKAMAGYLRIIPTTDDYAKTHPWTIGRVVVDPRYRRRGIAETLMRKAISLYDGDGSGFVLHAQIQAQALYAKLGFTAVGDRFYEAGIEHITMTLP